MRLFRHKSHGIDFDRDRLVERATDSKGRLRLQCWYCGDTIRYEGFDPCAVVLITNWDDPSRSAEQQFFAHAECFRRSGSGSDMYILDEDFE